jgi:hypothetical protein
MSLWKVAKGKDETFALVGVNTYCGTFSISIVLRRFFHRVEKFYVLRVAVNV